MKQVRKQEENPELVKRMNPNKMKLISLYLIKDIEDSQAEDQKKRKDYNTMKMFNLSADRQAIN